MLLTTKYGDYYCTSNDAGISAAGVLTDVYLFIQDVRLPKHRDGKDAEIAIREIEKEYEFQHDMGK